MNWFTIVILTILGLLFVVIVIFSAESDRRNNTERKKWFPRLTKRFPWRRNKEQLLNPPEFSNTESKSSVPDPYPDHKQAFDLLMQLEEYKELLLYKPSSTRLWIWDILRVCMGIVIITVAIVERSKHNALLGLVLLGAIPFAIGLYSLLKLVDSPLKRLPAIIQNKSDNYHAGDYMANWGVVLLVGIKTNDGVIKQYRVYSRLFKKIKQYDIGIAYIRNEQIIDFKKVKI